MDLDISYLYLLSQIDKKVLFSIKLYWSTMFILPSSIIWRIGGILVAFLWNGSSLSHLESKLLGPHFVILLKRVVWGLKGSNHGINSYSKTFMETLL